MRSITQIVKTLLNVQTMGSNDKKIAIYENCLFEASERVRK